MRKETFVFVVLMCVGVLAFAQPGDPNGGTKPGTVPITGIEWLLAAGGALGARQLWQRRKK